MTIPVLKIKVTPKPILKGRMDVRFPANILTEKFLKVSRANGAYTFDVDYTLLQPADIADPTKAKIAVLDEASGLYVVGTLADIISATTQIAQIITNAGPVDILPNAGVVLVNQGTGAAITLNMPLASDKSCPVLISDFKGDAGTNTISVVLTGSDKFPGGLTTWTINADTGSLFLRPISGVGYAL